MERASDLTDAYVHLEEALIILDKWEQHLAAAEVDSARVRLAKALAIIDSPEPR